MASLGLLDEVWSVSDIGLSLSIVLFLFGVDGGSSNCVGGSAVEMPPVDLMKRPVFFRWGLLDGVEMFSNGLLLSRYLLCLGVLISGSCRVDGPGICEQCWPGLEDMGTLAGGEQTGSTGGSISGVGELIE